MWFRQTHGVRLTVGRSGAGPARVARRSGRTRRIGGGDGTGAPATLPWTGRAPRWGYGPGPSRHLASTGPINLTVPPPLPRRSPPRLAPRALSSIRRRPRPALVWACASVRGLPAGLLFRRSPATSPRLRDRRVNGRYGKAG